MSVEKVPVRSVGEQKAHLKGNHDNPVSGNHPNKKNSKGCLENKGGPRTGERKRGQVPPTTPKHPP